MVFTSDEVTGGNHWQIASRVTKKSLFMVTNVLFHFLQFMYRTPNFAKNNHRSLFSPLLLNRPLQRTATFEVPLSDKKSSYDAQCSPKPGKFYFCVTAAGWPVCLPWTMKAAAVHNMSRKMEAEWRRNHWQGGSRVAVVSKWRHSGRHSDHSMDTIGLPKEAGTMVVQGRQKRRSNWYTMFTTVRIFLRGNQWPTSASILRPRRCVCLPPASFEQPVSDRWLFWICSKFRGDHVVHSDVWTSCVAHMNDQDNRSASRRPSTATWPVVQSHKGDTKATAPV